jgi:hypothetical protein
VSASTTAGSTSRTGEDAKNPTPADAGSPARGCGQHNPGHTHGTRASYVADRCRCASCRKANLQHARARSRAVAYGVWQPYADAAPVREHLHELRRAGLGVERIIALSGVGSGTVRQLLYASAHSGGPPTRLRTGTARKLLALRPERDVPADGSLCDASSTAERLRELLADGWSLAHLARLLGTDAKRLRATISRHRVRYATARRVAGLHTQLAAPWPPPDPSQPSENRTTGQSSHACRTPGVPADMPVADIRRTLAAARHTDTVLETTAEHTNGEGDVDEDYVDEDYVDEVAVLRAIEGSPVRLTAREQLEVIDRLTERGRSLRDIAAVLRTSPRTVSRRRARPRSNRPVPTTAGS